MRSVVVPEGNSVEVSCSWRTVSGAPEAPTAVRWQTFDHDGAPIGSAAAAGSLAAYMTVVVPGAALPGPAQDGQTEVTIQIEATFAGGDKDTRTTRVMVEKVKAFT